MERVESSLRTLRVLIASFVFLGGAASSGTDPANLDAELQFNQKFFGLISSALDADVVAFDEVVGSKINVRVKRDFGNFLKPDVELLDANFEVLDTGVVKQKTAESATIVGYELPDSGRYYLRVTSSNGLTGTYSLSVKGKPKKKVGSVGSIGAPGEIDGLSFPARAQSKLSGSVVRASGDLIPLAVELVSPTGVLVPLPPHKAKSSVDQAKLTLDDVGLPSLGSYQLRVTGQAGTTGGYQASFKIAAPKPISESVYEDEHPSPGAVDEGDLTLREVYFGRGLASADGQIEVVSPFTFVRTDPVSDLPVPGTLEPIFPGIDVSSPVPFELGAYYAPMIVPRNAVLVLRFDGLPSKASLALSEEGWTTDETPIRVSVNGIDRTFRAFVDGNDVILNPVFADSVGLPPSPLAVDSAGNGVASTIGAASISIVSGPNGLKSKGGGTYQPREDLLGSPDLGGVAIGFNPGNAVLDFFAQSSTSSATLSYSGFLPDDSPPRLIREKKFAGTYSPDFAAPAIGDLQAPTEISIVTEFTLDTAQNGGDGEYAGGVFRLRPLGPFREDRVIVRHTMSPLDGGLYRHTFELASKVKIPLKAPDGATLGEPYEVARAEYYEPDLENPIDPSNFDPFDPDRFENAKIENFLEARDRNGQLEDLTGSIDPLSTLTVRFDEAMLLESFRPHESFFVAENVGSNLLPTLDDGLAILGRVTSSEAGKAITFAPHREIQFGPSAGTIEPVGFGPFPRAFHLHLLSVPVAGDLAGLLGQNGAAAFLAKGRTGVTDLGGRSLALGLGAHTASKPIADLRFPFTTSADPSLPSIGVVAHRFLGAPSTGGTDDGDTGVAFLDVPVSLCGPKGNVYGPRIADVNLALNGFLSGAPVEFVQKIHDEFHPPPDGPFSAFAFGAATPIGGFSVLGGARMQHVYRAVDCSPDYDALAGTLLDLLGVRFAPLNGVVANTILPDVSIHAGHSAVVPDTAQNGGGIPVFGQSGLGGAPPNQFVFGGHYQTLGDATTDYVTGSYDATVKETGESLRRQLVYGSLQPDQVADFHAGKQVVIDSNLLAAPAGSPLRSFHPLPAAGFDVPFVYDNGAPDGKNYPTDPALTFGIPGKPRHHSLVLEYRVRTQPAANPPSTQNVFTFAFGMLGSALPRFRIFTFGAGCTACCNAGTNCPTTCAVSIGPGFIGAGAANSGGDPFEPDRIVNAIGPNVSTPGLQCFCVSTPQNHVACTGGLTDQTVLNPTAHDFAYGVATPPNQNNFGDNSRYFMIFDYVKRESLIRSPFVRAMPNTVTDPIWLEPIFTPPLSQLPAGTTLEARFRASTNGLGGTDASGYVEPADVSNLAGAGRRFIQFELRFVGDTSSRLTPVFDEIVIPFRK